MRIYENTSNITTSVSLTTIIISFVVTVDFQELLFSKNR